ncbi:MAG: type II toxin-antitoxin system antitoxin, RelB/DinJ family [Defluviitaleaceae bacterium]|nr:type II toxin-antitoxin system antitoxin, RelB/DinJ family [Defluviitaleaceae bacterium]
MAQINVLVPMDENLKDSFDTLCADLGYNVASVFSAFAEEVVNRRSLLSELNIERDPFYSPQNMARLKKSIADAEAGRLTHHDIVEVGDEEGVD